MNVALAKVIRDLKKMSAEPTSQAVILTRSGTSLLIRNSTIEASAEDLEKLMRYLREKVSVTACVISMETPACESPSSPFLAFFAAGRHA